MTSAAWRLVVLVVIAVSQACGGADPPQDSVVDAAGQDAQARDASAVADSNVVDGSIADATADAQPDCTDREMRLVECGNCGLASEICMQGEWEQQGACVGKGECAPAAIETRATALCGEEQRICDESCGWSEWFVVVPGTGDCEPGTTQLAQVDCPEGSFRHQTCSSSCVWSTDPDPCVDACGGAARATSFEDELDICIPSGPFVRGSDRYESTQPVATVTISSFYVDKYTVTNRRYKMCFDAGVCGSPTSASAQSTMLDPAYADHPVRSVTRPNALTFCDWDGGRRFLTEAEWEKAARGPAPSDEHYPWGGATWRCDLILAFGCPGYVAPPSGTVQTDPITAYPDDVSVYGMRGMFTAGSTWTKDWYQSDYYADPSSLVDPQGPLTGTFVTKRGHTRHFAVESYTTIPQRQSDTELASEFIRCGRDAG